jgi:hypothetical protein
MYSNKNLTIRAIEQIQSIGISIVANSNAKNVQSRWIIDISIDIRIWTIVTQIQWIVVAHDKAIFVCSID